MLSSHQPSSEVFLVHGHDDLRKEEVAEVIANVHGKRPTILHEQPDGGKTIIEKLEQYASMARFAIVLLTADDLGGADRRSPAARRKAIKPRVNSRHRARQNVILELGYFWAKLGRENVVVLCDDGVELPSDAHGVLYKRLDKQGNWKRSLLAEMSAAKLSPPVDAGPSG